MAGRFVPEGLVAVCEFALADFAGARVIVRPSGLKLAMSGMEVVTSISAAPLLSE